MKTTWFKKQRMDWIVEMIGIYGFINRDHIIRKFGVSVPQSSIDIRDVMAANPDLMRYDIHKKQYVKKD